MRQNAIVISPSDSRFGYSFDAETQRAMRLVREEEERRVFQAMFGSDTMIGSIKKVREFTGCGIRDAKDTVEKVLAQHLSTNLTIQEVYGATGPINVTPILKEEHPGFDDVTPGRKRDRPGLGVFIDPQYQMPELPPAALSQLMGEEP